MLPLFAHDEEDSLNKISTLARPSDTIEELLMLVRRMESKKRASFQMRLLLGSQMESSIKLFTLFKETRLGAHVWVHSDSGEAAIPSSIGATSPKTSPVLDRPKTDFY